MTKDKIKYVCVIGAGASGLVSIKELKEKNIKVKCFEAQSGIGGVFRNVKDGGRSYDSVELTVSNYFMAFSDFSPNKTMERRYWKVKEYIQYLKDYVDHFNLEDCIYFNHNIISANIVGKQIAVEVCHNGNEYIEYFDHLVICSGSHFIPKYPSFVENKLFEGEILHSSQYKNATKFKNKKVICVGIGESGADIVHEICNVTDCHVLVRDKPNVIPRWIKNHTNDSYTSYCFYEMGKLGIDLFMKIKAWFYIKFDKEITSEEKLIQKWIYERSSFMDKFFTKNDIFIKDIVDKRLLLSVGEVSKVLPNGIETNYGEIIKADLILCNTGFQTTFKGFGFGEHFMNSRNLFKQMIHPLYGDLISIIGWARPTQGGLPPCSEMQARYIAQLISGNRNLPNTAQLSKIIEKDKKYNEYLFGISKDIKSLVNYHKFMKEMGELIGCKPNFFSFKMLPFIHKLYFGSHLSVFYRLTSNDPKVRQNSFDVLKKMPVAYSRRRILFIVLFTFIFRPLEFFYLKFKRM